MIHGERIVLAVSTGFAYREDANGSNPINETFAPKERTEEWVDPGRSCG
jgi:hypothetical protein